MKLSIIIPYFNGEKWIAQCLDSLLKQDIPAEDYEIIVVDDGSTHSIEVLQEYVKNHSNIKYLWQENARHSAARDKGLTIAQGEYVFFCDCDDRMEENVIGRLYDIAHTQQADVLVFNYREIHESEKVTDAKRNFEKTNVYNTGVEFMSSPPYKVFAGPWEFIVRREFMEQNNLQFDPEMIMREEYLFFLQMMKMAGRVVKTDVDVYYYIQYPTSWVHSEGKKKNHLRYIQCMMKFLKYLTSSRDELSTNHKMTTEGIEALNRLESSETFIVLHNTFRYSTVKNNKKVIAELKSIGAYPVKNLAGKYQTLAKFINIYPLWMTACTLFHLLPAKIRYKYF